VLIDREAIMYPVLHLGSITVSTYTFMALVIFVLTYLIGLKLLPRTGLNRRFLTYAWLIIIPLALLGARAFYILQYPRYFLNNPLYIFNFRQGGYSAYGALLLTNILGFLVMWRKKVDFGDTWLIADALVPSLIVGHILWRVLCCFLAGCCYGKPAYGFPLAVTFNHPLTACAYRGIPVHPTQLYEAFGVFIILIIIMRLRERATFKGQLCWTYFLLYGVVRFIVEFFRGDVRPMITPNFSIHQALSLLLIIASLIIMHRWKERYPIHKTPQ